MNSTSTEVPVTEQGPGRNARPASMPLRVLVAEDDPATRTTLGYILQANGFHAETVPDGQALVDQAISMPYDLILMDLQMPEMDGIRALRLLRRTEGTQRMPVIVLSQHTDRDRVMQCADLGIAGFVVKQNLNIEKLLRSIQAICEQAATETPQVAQPAEQRGEDQSDEPQIDQAQWRLHVMELGRVAREQAQSIVESTDLPVLFADLPGQARDAVEAGDEEAEDLNDILEQESHLLLSVLGMANRSQQTGTRALDVDTAARWIGRAGLEEILADDGGDRQIAEEARPWLHRWWVHSMAVGHIAATLARPLGIQVAQARTAGLIHDVGRALLLKSSLSDKAQRCYDLGRNMAIATTFAEQSLLGLNHKQIGAEVCRRYGVPALLGGVVETHDQDETQIQRLDSASAQMARLISAADALAKSDGYASLPNDELRPIPAALAWHIQQINAQLNATLAELQTLLSWRLGEQMPQRMTQVVPMRGFTVAMLTETPLEANPYLRFLAQAGAAVQAVADPRELTSQQIICDVLVIDQTDQSLVGCLQTLRRLTQSDYLQAIPMLVLARRSDDPETTLKQAGLDLPIYATPIRMHTLCQSIRRLIEQG